jgi:hypothetical protein
MQNTGSDLPEGSLTGLDFFPDHSYGTGNRHEPTPLSLEVGPTSPDSNRKDQAACCGRNHDVDMGCSSGHLPFLELFLVAIEMLVFGHQFQAHIQDFFVTSDKRLQLLTMCLYNFIYC